jgi:hypothetical protein
VPPGPSEVTPGIGAVGGDTVIVLQPVPLKVVVADEESATICPMRKLSLDHVVATGGKLICTSGFEALHANAGVVMNTVTQTTRIRQRSNGTTFQRIERNEQSILLLGRAQGFWEIFKIMDKINGRFDVFRYRR